MVQEQVRVLFKIKKELFNVNNNVKFDCKIELHIQVLIFSV